MGCAHLHLTETALSVIDREINKCAMMDLYAERHYSEIGRENDPLTAEHELFFQLMQFTSSAMSFRLLICDSYRRWNGEALCNDTPTLTHTRAHTATVLTFFLLSRMRVAVVLVRCAGKTTTMPCC